MWPTRKSGPSRSENSVVFRYIQTNARVTEISAVCRHSTDGAVDGFQAKKIGGQAQKRFAQAPGAKGDAMW
jgi:hypothetical protein